jgi:hypothetical protein
MQKSLLIAVATACTVVIASAQAPNVPVFDVVSIKPNLTGGDQYLSTVQPDHRRTRLDEHRPLRHYREG